MQIEPPRPLDSELPERRPALSMTVLFVGIAIVLVVTVMLWLALWSGGINKAVKVDEPAPASQTK